MIRVEVGTLRSPACPSVYAHTGVDGLGDPRSAVSGSIDDDDQLGDGIRPREYTATRGFDNTRAVLGRNDSSDLRTVAHVTVSWD